MEYNIGDAVSLTRGVKGHPGYREETYEIVADNKIISEDQMTTTTLSVRLSSGDWRAEVVKRVEPDLPKEPGAVIVTYIEDRWFIAVRKDDDTQWIAASLDGYYFVTVADLDIGFFKEVSLVPKELIKTATEFIHDDDFKETAPYIVSKIVEDTEKLEKKYKK